MPRARLYVLIVLALMTLWAMFYLPTPEGSGLIP